MLGTSSALAFDTSKLGQWGSLPLEDLASVIAKSARLQEEISQVLSEGNKKQEDVTCLGMRFPGQWKHLGGLRVSPYACDFGAVWLQIQIINASTSREIDAAFATFGRERPDALFVGQDGFFNSRRIQLANMAARHALPMTSGSRDIAEVGGLMSYGGNITDAYRQMGVYAGRILKGANPADLPVVQASKFELVINHQTARMLGLTVPDKLLVAADEVIE